VVANVSDARAYLVSVKFDKQFRRLLDPERSATSRAREEFDPEPSNYKTYEQNHSRIHCGALRIRLLVLVGHADAYLARHDSGFRPPTGVHPVLGRSEAVVCCPAGRGDCLLRVCLDSEDRHPTFLGAILRGYDGKSGVDHAADNDCRLAPGDSVHRVDGKQVVFGAWLVPAKRRVS